MFPSAGGTSVAYRIAVMTDPESATGIRLAGVEVREATDPKAALEHLRALVSLDYGLAAVNEDLLQGTEDEVSRLMFFFQAEDGIRYLIVTGVQTCALPI